MSDELQRLRDERDALAATLSVCRDTFARYAKLHRAKGTNDGDEKADANQKLAYACDDTNFFAILAARDAQARKDERNRIVKQMRDQRYMTLTPSRMYTAQELCAAERDCIHRMAEAIEKGTK